MSGSSSYNTFESEDESSGWLLTSETSLDDELSDELTLLNGDEDCDEDTLSFDALIQLSMRLKKQYNLSETTVRLERCDKIWNTMQLVKKMQFDNEDGDTVATDSKDDEDEDKERKYSPSAADSRPNSAVPYIKYQPMQGNGNNALPNFYLAVKSQKKLYHCVTCGKQYSEKRSLRLHAQREHGIVIPKAKKGRQSMDNKILPSQESAESKIVNNSSSRDRDSSKSRLPAATKRSMEQQPPQRKLEKDANRAHVLSELKEEQSEGSLAREGKHAKTFICPVCGAAYRYQRGMTKHMMCVHNMTLAEARAKYRVGQAAAAKLLRKKETFLKNELFAEKKLSPKKVSSPKKMLSPQQQQQIIKKESPRVKKESLADVDSSGSFSSDASARNKLQYIFTCKTCGLRYSKKMHLRVHARIKHKIVISKDRMARHRPNERKREYQHYTCEFIRPAVRNSASKSARVNKQTDKGYYASIVKDELNEPKIMRSGRQITQDEPKMTRPRRACALNTSYTECTKEEEEVLQREFVFPNVTPESSGPSSGQTTPCFLCKKAYVDIRKHLIDYHRIISPDTILPLTEKAAESAKAIESGKTTESEKTSESDKASESGKTSESGKDSESVASSETVESLLESTSEIATGPKRSEKRKKSMKKAKSRKYSRVSPSQRNPVDGQIDLQCTVCSYKFQRTYHMVRHLNKYTINGVLREHLPPVPKHKRQKLKALEEPAVDPLALSDFSDSSRSVGGPRRNASDEGDADTNCRKRRISSSDERLSTSSEYPSKRRKMEDPTDDLANLGSDSRSDSVQYNNERDSAPVTSETDCELNDEGTKVTNPRDTRDSSDRDSGIGISITIKKCNNSYEVVEKDSGDDDKSKDFEHSKDDNTCSDSSSSHATPVNFVNDDQEARRREILNSLDYSVEKDVVESVGESFEDDNAFGKTIGEESCSSNDKETNYQWKEKEGYYREDACDNLPGKVPSLKVMCRTVLTRDDFTIVTSNDAVSHQCPVCYRYYPTERDVTVHMLEHKVSETEFCTTRVHAIPSSALRRYGRRAV